MTQPSYARTKDGQIEIRSAHGWHRASRLTATTDLVVLMQYPEAHTQQIAELKSALGIA